MFKRAQTKTHPWDGDIDDLLPRKLRFSLLLVALLALMYQPSSAQKVIAVSNSGNSENDNIKIELQLSRSEIQTAEDYQETISKLEFFIRNHLDYFSKYKKFEGLKYQNLLLETLLNLEKGTYCVDVDRLSKDLSKLTKSLKKEERELRKDLSLRKLYKNVYTLRDDIEVINDILTEDIAEELHNLKSSQKAVEIYLHKEWEIKKQEEEHQLKLYELQIQLENGINSFIQIQDSLNFTFDKTQMKELLKAEEFQKELSEILSIVFSQDGLRKTISLTVNTDSLLSDVIPSPTPPTPPSYPEPPRQDVSSNTQSIFPDKKDFEDNKSLSNEFNDSIFVKSSRIPIYIHNQLGNLIVQGWDKNKVVARYSYEVTAGSYYDSKDFLNSITLDMSEEKSGIHITSDIPSLHNTKRQVENSKMILYLPKKNVVNITNSFGKTEISRIKNNVTVTTKNSDVFIKDIIGDIVSVSKYGSTSFKNIIGDLNITSKRGKVDIENALSAIKITGSHTPVNIIDSRGDISLVNSGQIGIYNHIGDIDIINKNGQTTINSLDGDLTLSGSYKPFVISSINGSVDIVNKNSTIDLSEISGESIVMNKNGKIKAYNLQGPIDFSSYGGETYFIIDKSFSGNSIIRSDYGMVNIIVPQQSNIQLKASTEGGSIVSSYKAKIVKDDFLTTTTVGLGDKSKKLQVTGTNTTITIKDRK